MAAHEKQKARESLETLVASATVNLAVSHKSKDGSILTLRFIAFHKASVRRVKREQFVFPIDDLSAREGALGAAIDVIHIMETERRCAETLAESQSADSEYEVDPDKELGTKDINGEDEREMGESMFPTDKLPAHSDTFA